MKCNIKKAMAAQNVRQMVSTQGTVKRLWELATLLALSREFGFGAQRLKRFADEMDGIYKEVVDRARLTDKYDKQHREMTDIDTAIEELDRMPAADVRHERHGQVVWRERHSGGFRTVKCLYEFPDIIKENNIACKHIAKFDNRCTVKEPYCSECGKRLGDFINFCGNCGAKMDGKDIDK